MIVRGVVVLALLVSGLLVPPATATPAGSSVSAVSSLPSAAAAPGASVPMAKKKPRAQLSGYSKVRASGKVRVKVSSNAKKVKLTYRTKKNKKRTATIKVRKGQGAKTLRKGSKRIYARANATSKLRKSRRVRVRPAVPPVVTPPPVTPPVVTPPVVTPPVVTPPPVVDVTAPGPVAGLTVTDATESTLSLSWTLPGDADLAAVIVRRAAGQTAPASPTAGAAVSLSGAVASSVTDSGLAADTPYSYAVFTRDATGNTNPAPATVRATTEAAPDLPVPGPTVVAPAPPPPPVVTPTQPSTTPGPSQSPTPLPQPTATVTLPQPQPQPSDRSAVRAWVTLADGSQRLKTLEPSTFTAGRGAGTPIDVDHETQYQTFEGAGAALTDSSAWLLQGLDPGTRQEIMEDLFGVGSDSLGLSLVRAPFGATDFALTNYTFDDIPAGETDEGLTGFSIAHDEAYILPALRQARTLNPNIQILATPWSPPAWMKTSQTLNGGTLDPSYRQALADYLVKAIQAYGDAGVPIDAITPQNEPQHEAGTYPSMRMSAEEQTIFVRDHLGPALDRAGLATKLLVHDHNWDLAEDPLTILQDPRARGFVDGVAFHCYGGDPVAQSTIRARYPSQGVWFTECSGGGWSTDFGANVEWATTNLVIDNFRNWGRSLLMWNLALDDNGGPTNGGCQDCRGVITIDPSTGSIRRNEEYFVLGHLTRFVTPGARRIASTNYDQGGPQNVAFRNPDGSLTLLVHSSGASTFSVNWSGMHADYSMPAGATMTLHWDAGLPPMTAEPGLDPSSLQDFEAEGSHYAAYQTATTLSRSVVHSGETSLRSHADSGTWHTAGLHPVNAPTNMRSVDRVCLWVYEESSTPGNTLALRLIDQSGTSQELWSDDPAVGSNPLTSQDAWVQMCFTTSAFTQIDASKVDRLQLTTYWPGTYYFDDVTVAP